MVRLMDNHPDGVPLDAPVTREHITMALDAAGLYGPEVDCSCGTFEGNPAGDVDDWELGTHQPTRDQVRLLAALTDMPVAFFYEPFEPLPWINICSRTGPKGQRCRRVSGVPVPPAAENGAKNNSQGALF